MAVAVQAWRAGEFNARLWQDMIKFLPASFEGNLTHPRNALVAHSGKVFLGHAVYTNACVYVSLTRPWCLTLMNKSGPALGIMWISMSNK